MKRFTPSVQIESASAQDRQTVSDSAELLRMCPQIEIDTEHLIHAGMYARTIHLPKDAVIASVLVSKPTIVIVNGALAIFTGKEAPLRLAGYHVLAGAAFRKQIIRAYAETDITMLFPTSAKTVEEAEREFTPEPDMLLSRGMGQNLEQITGE